MATPPSSSASSNRPPSGSGTTSGGSSASSSSRKERPKPISVRIQPTIGPCFSLCLVPNTKITSLKETISDRMGLSPQKMTLLLHNNELVSGTLSSNSIEDGTEIRLVPAVESGVTTTNSVDPVAMMKHSMSGISDQQIDDFLNGKSPLSVAIRVGESVVVVNLHRAKVEEIEVEPPPTKRRCTRARRPSSEETDSPRSSPGGGSSSANSSRHLNTNTCSSTEELMDTSEHLAAASSMRRRASSRYMDHSIRTGHDHRHSNGSPNNTLATPSPIVVGESSTAAGSSACRSTGLGGVHPHSLRDAQPPCVADTSSHLTRSTQPATGVTGSGVSGASHSSPVISNLLKSGGTSSSSAPAMSSYSPVSSPPSSVGSLMPPTHSPRDYRKNAYYRRQSSRKVPESYKLSPTGTQGNGKPPTPRSQETSRSSSHKSPDSSRPCCSSSHRAKTVSRSVQTDPETVGSSRSREERESSSRRVGSKREMRLPDSGVNMKRKAVMEAISEILKKMYANSDKGRLPGSFKGRFSSEFTCDSDMSEILHSKTTMTSYNSEMEEAEKSSEGHTHSAVADPALVSKAKFEENEQLRDKVAQLKWKMQHRRAIRMAKRKGERSPCGWMEALNCSMPGSPPTARERIGYAGMKRGFLLSD